jgi:hypothetical protein
VGSSTFTTVARRVLLFQAQTDEEVVMPVLTRSKDTQMDKARRTVRDVVKYAQEVARDERLRADVSAALAHGSKAGDQLKKDIQAGGIYSRLAEDRKLRRNLRAMLDDLDSASDRVRRKKSHRLRNFVLMLVGAIGAAAAFVKIRSWIGTDHAEPDPVT